MAFADIFQENEQDLLENFTTAIDFLGEVKKSLLMPKGASQQVMVSAAFAWIVPGIHRVLDNTTCVCYTLYKRVTTRRAPLFFFEPCP